MHNPNSAYHHSQCKQEYELSLLSSTGGFYLDTLWDVLHECIIRFFHHEPKTTNGPNIFVVNKWQFFLLNCFAGENDTKLSCQNAQIIILYLWQSKICVGR